MLPVEALLSDLVPSCYKVKAVCMIELLSNICAEGPSGATLIAGPAFRVRVVIVIRWVRPQQVTKESSLWRLLNSVVFVNLIYLFDVR